MEYTENNERRWIDVSIRHAAAGTNDDVARAARKKGEAARRGERCKHDRYPGTQLTAFVVEVHGRFGGEAQQWIRQQALRLPAEDQTREQTRAYQALSCSLQTQLAGNAEQPLDCTKRLCRWQHLSTTGRYRRQGDHLRSIA